jgi:glutaconate CoA-transferase subunit B
MTASSEIAPQERLITSIARLILDPSAPPARHVAVGMASPVPAAACWLLKKSGHPIRISLLQRQTGSPFSEGGRELFDLAGQGRIDLFFLGGGQIDSEANINMVGTGEWPGTSVRFPGSFGSAFMYMVTPRTILFREEHSPRVLVERVDHISAPGRSPPEVVRRGSAQALVTGRCVFSFDGTRFTLASIHPGETRESIDANTGMTYLTPPDVPVTPDPTPQELALLRGPVCDEMLATYPDFCRRVWGRELEETAA